MSADAVLHLEVACLTLNISWYPSFQQAMKQLTRRPAILDRYGDHFVTLATANTHSYRKGKSMHAQLWT